MVPIELWKWQFACRLYGMAKKDREKASHKLRREYENSPVLRERLAAVGYKHDSHKLRHADLLVYQEVLLLDDEFWNNQITSVSKRFITSG